MSSLSRWNPFKFRRKKDERDTPPQRHREGQAQRERSALDVWRGSIFDEPFFRAPFAEIERWFGDFSPGSFWPSVDVVDEKNAIRVTAELPGMDKDDIQVHVDEGLLILRGEKRNELESDEDGCYRTERSYGLFHRTIPLPAEVDLDQVDASFDKGVLSVKLPKKDGHERSDARSIPIR